MTTLDANQIRQQFACFRENPPVYLDSAATAQVPDAVLDAMNAYYTDYKGNVHRGMHQQTAKATEEYEKARSTVQKFINAQDPSEIIFTKNCTEAINLAAWSWAFMNVQEGDAIVLSVLEHHSNIVPWQQFCATRDAELLWIDIDDDGQLKLDQLTEHLGRKNVRLVSITGQSNVIGMKPDLPSIITRAHTAGAKVLVDAAQLVVHEQVDAQELECDFLAFSGHKLYGPTGIGVLYATKEVQDSMCEGLGGGGMIKEVHRDGFTAADAPAKFEGGTPPIAEAIGLGAAIEWLSQFKWKDIEAYEEELMQYAVEQLSSIEGLTFLATSYKLQATSCVSFTIDGIHPHDLTDILGEKNISLRAGHHCTMPLHEHFGIPASTRLSLAIYNTKDDIDALKKGIEEALTILK